MSVEADAERPTNIYGFQPSPTFRLKSGVNWLVPSPPYPPPLSNHQVGLWISSKSGDLQGLGAKYVEQRGYGFLPGERLWVDARPLLGQ